MDCERNLVMDAFQSLLSWISCIGPLLERGKLIDAEGFNPCCLGLAVLATRPKADMRKRRKFQSLLSWISCIGTEKTLDDLSAPLFQSLLSWISCIGAKKAEGENREKEVSILVVLD